MRLRPGLVVFVAMPFLIAALVVAGGGIASAGYASVPYAPSYGLKHHWALNEEGGTVATDSVGVQPGTLLGDPVWQPEAGRFGGAIEFDGVDDRVDLATIDIPSGSGMSISLWFKAYDFEVPDARFISKATGTQSADHYWMVSTINATGLRFRLKAGGFTTTLATPTGLIGVGEWFHVAVTYDGATMRIFRDGEEVASTAKTGTIANSAAVPVAMGNQPAGSGDMPFDGLLDDVRIYDRALTPAEIAAMVPPKPPFIFTLWYGDVQEVGHLGTPQQWVNVVGQVSNASGVDSLYYTLNGGARSQLSVGPDGFRLADDGDFNIEIDTGDLRVGANDVTITGVHFNGKRADTTMTVSYRAGVSWTPTDTLAFESASVITDEAAVIDGHWELTTGGVRTVPGTMGYDRLLVAGQRHWRSDFEVLMPITIHGYETVFPDNGPAIGVGFGWTGHTGAGQPRLGHPYQAIGFIRGLASSPYLQLMRNGDVGVAVVPTSINVGTRYLMRIRTETLTATTSRVRMRVWEDGTPEPASWQIQSDFVTRGGSILLIAHRADVTFGNTIIQPLSSVVVSVRDTPAPGRLSVLPNAPNPFGDGTAIRFVLSEPADVEIDVFDVRGRMVDRRVISVPAAGVQEILFDASAGRDRPLASGVYFYRVTALGDIITRKMVISR